MRYYLAWTQTLVPVVYTCKVNKTLTRTCKKQEKVTYFISIFASFNFSLRGKIIKTDHADQHDRTGPYITGKNNKLEANDDLPGLPLNLPFLTVHVVHRCHTDTWKKSRKKMTEGEDYTLTANHILNWSPSCPRRMLNILVLNHFLLTLDTQNRHVLTDILAFGSFFIWN